MTDDKRCSEKKIELLAPAGCMEALIAAVNAGADAVYIAGNKFGARRYAANFDDDAVADAVKYSHIRGVKVYVAMNTLVHNHEIDEYFEKAEFFYKSDIDAVIVQDVGMLRLLIDKFPGLEVHASTQMTLHSSKCVMQMESMGVSRSILARELTDGEIKYIKKVTNCELEVFAAGALCVSYSGQCLMSSLIGGRSGNRGNCAQPCRQSYQLIDEGKTLAQGHLLSTKDLQVTDRDKYCFDSLKIEGRLKSPEYIYAVTSLYRAVIDGKDDDTVRSLREKAERIFSRGTTGGFLDFHEGERMLTVTHAGNKGTQVGKVVSYDSGRNRLKFKASEEIRTNDEIQIRNDSGETTGARVEYADINGVRGKVCPEGSVCEIPFKYKVNAGDVILRTLDHSLVRQLSGELRHPYKKISVDFKLEMKIGEFVELYAVDEDGNTATAKSSEKVQTAQKSGLLRDKIVSSLEKLGDTPYRSGGMSIDADENSFIQLSAINSLRRDICVVLDEKRSAVRGERSNPEIEFESLECVGIRRFEPKLTVSVKSLEMLESAVKSGADEIYYESLADIEEAVRIAIDGNAKIYLKPGIIINDEEYKTVIEVTGTNGLSGIVASNYGLIYVANETGMPFVADSSLNVYNTLAFNALAQMGASSVTLSHELTLDDIGILNEYGLNDEKFEECEAELIIFGKIPVMTMRYDAFGELNPGNRAFLKDRKGKEFSVQKDEKGRSAIYNSDILFNIDEIDNLKGAGISRFRLDFCDESPEFVEYTVGTTLKYLNGEYIEMNEFKDYVRNSCGAGLTRGHLMRGVE